MITAVIVDDEIKSREVLKRLLQEVDVDLTIVGEADSVEAGFELINKENPQLVFLDVEMLDGTGFNLLEKFDDIDFKIIFITAYDKYAIKAFKYSAIDYLLKPTGIEELESALIQIEKLIKRDKIIDKENFYKAQIKTLINNNRNAGDKRLTIRGAAKIEFVDVDDILFCAAEESYSVIKMVNGNDVTATKPLKYFDEILCEYENFFRVSKSCLINLKYIKSYVKTKEIIELKNGIQVELSRRRKKAFLERMATE